MSAEQNIQAVQAAYAAFGRGDIPGVLAQLDESIEWVTPETPGLPESGTRRGHQGVLEFFRNVNECWEFLTFEPREFIAGGDSLAVEGHYRAKARNTGVIVDCDWVMIWKFRNGKCIHFQEYTDTAALAHALTAQAAGA
jgi:ketosteroid isomerase-like protein